jgi:predicted transcriptional regulator YheO
VYNPNSVSGIKPAMSSDNCNEEKDFVEFRRKVRGAEVLSAAMERLLRSVNFSGRISVVVQNGRVLKSGYEEGFFRQRDSGTMLERGVAIEP